MALPITPNLRLRPVPLKLMVSPQLPEHLRTVFSPLSDRQQDCSFFKKKRCLTLEHDRNPGSSLSREQSAFLKSYKQCLGMKRCFNLQKKAQMSKLDLSLCRWQATPNNHRLKINEERTRNKSDRPTISTILTTTMRQTILANQNELSKLKESRLKFYRGKLAAKDNPAQQFRVVRFSGYTKRRVGCSGSGNQMFIEKVRIPSIQQSK